MNTCHNRPAFKLKASLFTLTVLQLYSPEIKAVDQQLLHLAKQTPHFFQYTPLVLELQRLETTIQLDFLALTQCLREHGLILVGARGGTTEQHRAAIEAGLAILAPIKSRSTIEPPKPTTATRPMAKLITQPVRSGQQIYARQGDLIILASVSPGAELLADGHIHVYGRLQGRALAGISGNQEACIFCKTLAAELVSIAGHYWVNEDLRRNSMTENVYIYLRDEHLQINTIY